MGAAYRDRPARRVAITDRLLIKKILADRQRRALALDPTCRQLYDKLRMLKIDRPAARASLPRHSPGWASHNLAIDMLADMQLFMKRCRFGRAHSNLTNLPASLRCYLTARGKHLTGIDFSNFQPFLFWHLARQRHGARPMPPDAGRYRDVCLDGRFYEELAGEKILGEIGRDKVKECVFFIMYGKGEYGGDIRRIAGRFARRFPSVYTTLQAWKDEARDYRVVSWELQRAESNFIIGRVAPALLERFASRFVGTIHDAVVVPEDLEVAVQAVLMAEAHKHFGVSLTVKPTRYTPPARRS